MSAMASQITGVSIVCSTISSDADQSPAQKANNTENVSIWWHHHDASHSADGNFEFIFWCENCGILILFNELFL